MTKPSLKTETEVETYAQRLADPSFDLDDEMRKIGTTLSRVSEIAVYKRAAQISAERGDDLIKPHPDHPDKGWLFRPQWVRDEHARTVGTVPF